MRIGIVINQAWNIYNFRLGLVKSLLASNHEVIAIAPQDEHRTYLEGIGCQFYHVNIKSKGTNPFADLNLIYSLYRTYKKAKLDVVLHYTIKPNIYGTYAAKMAGIPCINNVTGLGTVFIRPEKISSKIAMFLYKTAFKYPQTIFFQNQDDRELFIKNKLVRAEITDILPGSGIDPEYFKPSETPKKNATFTFLLVARLLFDKGILEYIQAIRILKKKGLDAKFQLLGKIETDNGLGVSKCLVDQWVEEGLIDYLGTTKDVRPIMMQADCVLLPSYREGTPRTLLEAASMGKPIIATDVPGCRETIKHEYNGFLCKVKDPEDLSEKMERIITLDEEVIRRMGKNSRSLVMDKFDQSIVIEKYFVALSSLAQTKKRKISYRTA